MEIKYYQVTFVLRPIWNHKPYKTISLFEIYKYETSLYAKDTQTILRGKTDEKEQRIFKEKNLNWVVPAGTFDYIDDNHQLTQSGAVCMDLDYLCLPSEIDEENGDPVTELKEKLLKDPYFETLLLFRSPRGRGLKWWVPVDLTKYEFRYWFLAIRNYTMTTYHLTEKQVDAKVGHPSAGCFLGHDPQCYLKPELYSYFNTKTLWTTK